jgi:very-short-patch-repair endonuclease
MRSKTNLSSTDPLVISNRLQFESEHGISVNWEKVSCIKNAPKSGLPDPGKTDIHCLCKLCKKEISVPWPKRGSEYVPEFICLECIRIDEESKFGAKILNWDSLPKRQRGKDSGRIVPSRPELHTFIEYECPSCSKKSGIVFARTGRKQGSIKCDTCLQKEFEDSFGAKILNWPEVEKTFKGSVIENGMPKTKSIIRFNCKKCGKISEKFWYLEGDGGAPKTQPICKDCQREELTKINPRSVSAAETEIADFVSSLGFFVERNLHSIIPMHELDIIVRDKKIAIEFDGLFYHTEDAGKGKNYHLAKTELCEDIGFRLIHVFEDEWAFKKEIVKSRISNLLGISKEKIWARKCSVVCLNSDERHTFMEKNHIQGDRPSSFSYGLKYGDEIVSAMTFCKPRITVGNESEGWELLRFANKLNTSVPGAASRLLAKFTSEHPGEVVYSYADRRWSDGHLYEKIGFRKKAISTPNYWYVDHLKRIHRSAFMKHKLVEEGFDPNMSEDQIMRSRGYSKIWDCGTISYVLDPKNNTIDFFKNHLC